MSPSAWGMDTLFGDRLMVGHGALNPGIVVRIHIPEPL